MYHTQIDTLAMLLRADRMVFCCANHKALSPSSCRDHTTCLQQCFKEDCNDVNIAIASIFMKDQHL